MDQAEVHSRSLLGEGYQRRESVSASDAAAAAAQSVEVSPASLVRHLHPSLRAQAAEWFYRRTHTSDVAQILLSLVCCGCFVAGTYTGELYAYKVVGYVVASICILDYLVRLYLAESRVRYVVSPYALIDLATIIPTFAAGREQLNFLRVVRLLHLVRLVRLWRLSVSELRRQIMTLTFTMMSMMFIATALICITETGELTKFHTALYFIIVTTFTVGYGDFAPKSEAGRVVIMLFLLCAVVVVPMQTQQIVDILARRSKFSGSFKGTRGQKHIIITGHITGENVTGFLEELYHSDRTMRERVKCVVLTNKPPVDADRDTILRCMAIKRFRRELRMSVQILSTASKQYLVSTGIEQVICFEEIKNSMLSRALVIPGVTSLICNLFITRSLLTEKGLAPWVDEYNYGNGQEIYACPMPLAFVDRTFTEAVSMIYKTHGATLFALSTHRGNHVSITLNPDNDYRITGREVALLLTQNETIVARLQEHYEKDDEKPGYVPILYNEIKRRANKGVRSYRVSSFPRLSPEGKVAPSSSDSVVRRPLEEAMHECVDGMCTDHVLVCAHSIAGLRLLLEDIRTQFETLHIVVLTDTVPTEEHWGQVAYIPEVYIVVGSTVVYADLQRAGIEYASQVLLLSRPLARDLGPDDEGESGIIADADTILAYYNIESNVVKMPHVVVDLVTMSNGKFFRSRRLPGSFVRQHGVEYLPSYAAGRLFFPAVFDALLAHTYFNPYITAAICKLLDSTLDSEQSKAESHLAQIPLPDDNPPTYGELFDKLVEEGVVPLGLFRCEDARGGMEPYVFTNPPPDTQLARDDRVFALKRTACLRQPLWRSVSRLVLPVAHPVRSPPSAEGAPPQLYTPKPFRGSVSQASTPPPVRKSPSMHSNLVQEATPPPVRKSPSMHSNLVQEASEEMMRLHRNRSVVGADEYAPQAATPRMPMHSARAAAERDRSEDISPHITALAPKPVVLRMRVEDAV
eukprot:m51a1_g4455 putative cation channel family protein (974) ;mRNA; r:170815-175326